MVNTQVRTSVHSPSTRASGSSPIRGGLRCSSSRSLRACPSEPRSARSRRCAQPCARPSSSRSRRRHQHRRLGRTTLPHIPASPSSGRTCGSRPRDGSKRRSISASRRRAGARSRWLCISGCARARSSRRHSTASSARRSRRSRSPSATSRETSVATSSSPSRSAPRTRQDARDLRGRRRVPRSHRAAERGRRRDRWLHNAPRPHHKPSPAPNHWQWRWSSC